MIQLAWRFLLHRDRRTDLLDQYRFCHRTPLSTVGGYDTKTLDESAADPLSVLAKKAGNAPKRPSPRLEAGFERYREYVHALAKNQFSKLGDSEYARTCAFAVKNLLKDDSPWIDRRIAQIFVIIEVELAKRNDLDDVFKIAYFAPHGV
jgi:hypothetical protein